MLANLGQQLGSFWQQQSRSRRISLVVISLAVIVVAVVFLVWASTPTYAVAYRGLSESDAGEIVQKLEEAKIPYRLKDTGTILVPSDKVYEVRLKMAREGLPKTSQVGFELFSNNTLGMTEFTQRVNYQRALEGELERTISNLEAVEMVRVHLVLPEKSLLARDQVPPTASVVIKEKPGKYLDKAQVRAITHLVASSVEGLTPENVVIVDAEGNLLASGSQDETTTAVQADTFRNAEQAAAAEIQRSVQNLLNSVLGPNRSVVQAQVVMDWTQRELTSQTFNPTPAAIRSSQKITESYTGGAEAMGGVPGAASNLPTPVPVTQGGTQTVTYQRTEETVNYEITQVQTHEIQAPGQIKRISLSVLVDGMDSPEQLQVLRSAIAAAAGIDETRGDMLAVESMAFDRTYYEEQAKEMQKSQQTDLYFRIGEIVLAVLLVVGLAIYLQRVFRNLRLASGEAWITIMKPVSEAALPTGAGAGAMAGAGARPSLSENLASVMGMLEQNQQAALQAGAVPEGVPGRPKARTSQEDEQLQRALARLAEESPATVAEVIQIWLNESGK